MKIDLLTVSALTASDGSVIASGATIKFETYFEVGNTNVRVFPKIYRSRELFELGYSPITMNDQDFPKELYIQTLTENDFYTLTPQTLYTIVRDQINNFYGGSICNINIIED